MRIFSTIVCRTLILGVSLWSALSFASPKKVVNATSTQLECARLLRNGQFDQVRAVLEEDRKAAEDFVYRLRMHHQDSMEAQKLEQHWAALFGGDIISTPLESLVHISNLMKFKTGQTLIDIGSGHGDPGFVFGALNPGLEIVGYDIVKEKVDGANRSTHKLGLNNVRFIQQDLSEADFVLPEADYYYLFNPVNEDILVSLVKQIKKHSEQREIKILVFAGGWAPHVLERYDFYFDPQYKYRDLQVFTTNPPPLKQNLKISELENARTARLLEKYKIFAQEERYITYQTPKAVRGQRAKYKKALFDALGKRPAAERLHFLRQVLTGEALIRDDSLIDALAGLRVPELDEKLKHLDNLRIKEKYYGDEEIWYSPNAGQQTSWSELLKVVERMKLPWSRSEGVADLGSGLGRLGILIGALFPHIPFTGIEIVGARVQNANRAARDFRFENVRYVTANLADPGIELPLAEHIYMYNPTTPRTSEIVTKKLLELSKRIRFHVYLLSIFKSSKFEDYFEQVDSSHPFKYHRNRTPAP